MITGGGKGWREENRRKEDRRCGNVVEERERVWDSGCKGKGSGSGGREGIEWAGWQKIRSRSRLSLFNLVEGTNEEGFMR